MKNHTHTCTNDWTLNHIRRKLKPYTNHIRRKLLEANHLCTPRIAKITSALLVVSSRHLKNANPRTRTGDSSAPAAREGVGFVAARPDHVFGDLHSFAQTFWIQLRTMWSSPGSSRYPPPMNFPCALSPSFACGPLHGANDANNIHEARGASKSIFAIKRVTRQDTSF